MGENSNSQKNICSQSTSQSLSSDYSDAPKISTLVQPCSHNCGSAVSTPRLQYSRMLWEMPWKTLRLIFSTLWKVSKILIASKTTNQLLQATASYQQTQRALRQLFSTTLTLSPH